MNNLKAIRSSIRSELSPGMAMFLRVIVGPGCVACALAPWIQDMPGCGWLAGFVGVATNLLMHAIGFDGVKE